MEFEELLGLGGDNVDRDLKNFLRVATESNNDLAPGVMTSVSSSPRTHARRSVSIC